MDTVAYNQAIDYYKNDLLFLSNNNNNQLIFQQDNAPCHVSKGAREKLKEIKHIENWPPNSPDLSPIEIICSVVRAWLEGEEITTLDELKNEIVYI